jgi:hypothetical protein
MHRASLALFRLRPRCRPQPVSCTALGLGVQGRRTRRPRPPHRAGSGMVEGLRTRRLARVPGFFHAGRDARWPGCQAAPPSSGDRCRPAWIAEPSLTATPVTEGSVHPFDRCSTTALKRSIYRVAMRVNTSQPIQCTGTELKLDTPNQLSEPDHKFLTARSWRG